MPNCPLENLAAKNLLHVQYQAVRKDTRILMGLSITRKMDTNVAGEMILFLKVLIVLLLPKYPLVKFL